MGDRLPSWEHIIENSDDARVIWEGILRDIKNVNRQDILSNPVVLDIGGGMGNFSEHLNQNGIRCVSLDKQNLEVNPSANPVTGNAYNMPFADASFDIAHGSGVFHDAVYHHNYPLLLQEIARILKPRGILAVTVLAPPPTEEIEKLFRRLSKKEQTHLTLWEKK